MNTNTIKNYLAIGLFFGLLSSCGSVADLSPDTSNPSTTTPPSTTPPTVTPPVTPPVVTPPVVTPPITNPATILRTAKGEWLASDGGAGGTGSTNAASFKNFHYSFEVKTNNQKIEIGVSSPDINIEYNFFDPLGKLIERTIISRNIKKTYTVNAGVYRVVVSAARYAVGKFELTLLGVNDEPKKIGSTILKSNTQTWGPLGGGGYEETFKNHYYTFDVNENNQAVDIEMESPDVDITLVLYDPLEKKLQWERSDRREFILRQLNKGTYKIMAASNTRGGLGNYNLKVNGQVSNLQKRSSQIKTIVGEWKKGDQIDRYDFETLNDNDPLDIELLSPDVNVFLELANDKDELLQKASANKKSETIIRPLAKGKYRIYVSPRNVNGTGGKYTLNVVGRFK
jgi:hypothetical protein